MTTETTPPKPELDEPLPPFTVGQLKELLAQLPDSLPVIVEGMGPVNHLHVHPGAEAFLSIMHLTGATRLVVLQGGRGPIRQAPKPESLSPVPPEPQVPA